MLRDAIQNFRRHLTDPSFLRYLLAGGTVFLVYTGGTLALNAVGVPFGLAIALAYAVAALLHFTLQREFVFKHEAGFHISTREQVKRYVVIGAVQYAITWSATHFLPEKLGVSEQIVYLVTVLVVTVVAFLLMRLHVFAPAADESEEG